MIRPHIAAARYWIAEKGILLCVYLMPRNQRAQWSTTLRQIGEALLKAKPGQTRLRITLRGNWISPRTF